MKRLTVLLLVGVLAIILPAMAFAAQENGAAATDLNKVGEVLVVILVLSVVFEVALTPVFNWRIFLTHFEGKGVKTPIVIVTALVVFWSYDLDIVRDLLVALGHSADLTFGGQVLTALLIAGGSDGVFRIFTKLKIRNPAERQQKAAQARAAQGQPPVVPPQDDASA